MRWRGYGGRVAATLAAGVLFTLGWGAVSASADSTGSISGTVTAAATGHAPLEGILVCAWTLDEEDDECDLTASDGAYTIANLPAGSYKVDFWGGSSGYINQYYDGKSSWAEADVVPVSEEATTSGIDAELVLGGTITGTVVDATTKAGIAGFNVCASDGSHEGCEETDVDGNYTITGLPDGDYIVYFESFGDSDYVNQYYNGQPSWEVANPVHMTAESTVSNINAEMQVGGRIAGAVTRALDGMSLPNIEVCAHEDRAPNYWAVRCTRTTADGGYTIHGLATGNYKVEFSPDWPGEPGDGFPAQFFNDKSSLAEADWVAVTAPGTTGGIDEHLGPKPMQPIIPSPVVPPPPVETRPTRKHLVVKLSAPAQTLGAIRKSGSIKTSCRLSAAGLCFVVATIGARDAKTLGLKVKKGAKVVTIGRGRARLGKAGSTAVKVGLMSKVRRVLSEVKKLKIRLTVTASSPGRQADIKSTILTVRSMARR